MFCEKCGKEVLKNERYCTNCGYKIITELEGANNNNQKIAEPLKKKKIKWIIGIIVAVIVICIAFGVTGGGTEEYDFEANELAEVINSGEAEEYYEAVLHVHGILYRHPTEEGLYVLCKDADDENGIFFTSESLDEELGDGSEMIVTGYLGTSEKAPSMTVLIDTEIKVVKKAERVYSVGCIEDLLNDSDKYIGKKVCAVGCVGGVGDSIWMNDYSLDDGPAIRLTGEILNIPYDAVEDWESAIVIGTVKQYSSGEVVLEVESVE